MKLYALPQDADSLALSLGELDFYNHDRRAVAQADGAVSPSATAFNIDQISPTGGLKQFDLLQTASGELIRVGTFVFNPVQDAAVITVASRGVLDTTATAIADNESLLVRSTVKVHLLHIATRDIVNYHKQTYVELWLAGSELMQQACILQAIYLYHTLDARKIAEYIRAISAGSYSDTVLSISQAAERRLSPDARVLIDEALFRSGVSAGEYQRA